MLTPPNRAGHKFDLFARLTLGLFSILAPLSHVHSPKAAHLWTLTVSLPEDLPSSPTSMGRGEGNPQN